VGGSPTIAERTSPRDVVHLSSWLHADVRFGSFADISQSSRHVRFTPESRHSSEADPGVYIGDNRKIILGISETEARI
jgi:hypothetical protein